MSERGLLERLVAPRGVLLAFVAIFLAALLLVPFASEDDRAAALSSYGTAAAGGRGLHDVLDRLGFATERRLRPFRDTLDAGAVYVVFAPTVPLTAGEVRRLLEAVRAGAALFVVPRDGPGLADSLGVRIAPVVPERPSADSGRIGVREAFAQAHIRSVLRPVRAGATSDSTYAAVGAVTFESVATPRGSEPTIIGRPLGRGRMVVAAEEAPFTNDAVRRGDPAVLAVRLVEWLVDGDVSRPIVFDEYHHGYGMHADMLGFMGRTLVGTPPGRVVFVLGTAGLLLLLAVGARPVRPAQRRRIQRRSPLEHVEALARAYAAVPATARAVRLLVRGLHRRHGATRAPLDEAAYLRGIAARAPHVRADVETVVAALNGVAAADGDGITTAILHIEGAIAP